MPKPIVFFIVIFVSLINFSFCASYVGGVIQHEAIAGDSPSSTLEINSGMYINDIRTASKHGVQILVFPEFGFGGDYANRTNMANYCEKTPTVGTNPCLEGLTHTPVLFNMSCAAREANMVVVINTCEIVPCSSPVDSLCPSDGRYLYNTEIAFSETGEILAKYHKAHPWFTKIFNTPEPADLVSFRTSFGVEFGLFVCFDIMFDTPAVGLVHMGVRNFPYSASINIPIIAPMLESGWSLLHGVNILASNSGNNVSGIWSKGSKLTDQSSTAEVEERLMVAIVPAL